MKYTHKRKKQFYEKVLFINKSNSSNVNISSSSSDSETNKNVKNSEKKETEEKLNVIIFGTDSVSRLNFRRHLPKTYEYLTKELGAFEFLGFNKVADNTFPNLMPILMGLSDEELFYHPCIHNIKEKFDDCPIIWKEYKKKGYITSHIEVS